MLNMGYKIYYIGKVEFGYTKDFDGED